MRKENGCGRAKTAGSRGGARSAGQRIGEVPLKSAIKICSEEELFVSKERHDGIAEESKKLGSPFSTVRYRRVRVARIVLRRER